MLGCTGEIGSSEEGRKLISPSSWTSPLGHDVASAERTLMYNRIQSSRRLERESQRNVELMWLTGRLMPDFKTIANFRKDNGKAIRGVCRQFVCAP